jgi:hypothetical protein
VLGDVDITGHVTVGNNGEFIVDGKRTIHGSYSKIENAWEPLVSSGDDRTRMKWVGRR